MSVNGSVVATNASSGPAGTWQLLGPFEAGVTDGTLSVTTTGGSANVSGLVVYSGTGTPPPGNGVPSVTSPGAQSGTVGVAIAPVGVVASDPDASQSLTFSATGLPAGLSLNAATGVVTGTPTVVGTSSVTITATDNGTPPQSGSTTFTWTVTTGGSGGTGFDPTKVTDSFVAGGNWMKSLSADWLPDGTVLVLAEGGVVYRVNPVTGAQSVALDITAKVFLEGESGALDILVDQAGTGFYVYYTAADSDRLRISHFTLGSATETVIWNNPGLGYNAARAVHLGGALNFGPDGKLYLTVGDRYEGRSQDLTNVFGKVLRINADGTVPTDNPFYDGAGPNADEIWAYGFRNPYRASFDDVTGLFWVGDVGGNVDTNAYEEVNLVEAGRNYGWPLCEGPVSGPKNGPLCPSGVTGPVSYYSHAIGEGCCRNRAIVGGEVYRASAFPLAGHYLYLDYATNEVSWVELGPDGRTAVSTGLVTEVGSFTPVWLGVGPDGNVYWLSLGFGGNGQLRRLTYTGTVNRPPVITAASATPTIGAAPLAVVFTGAATDPDGTPVTYAWDFGDGGTSSAADPTHTYASSGTYQARLLVTSGGATVSSNPIAVVVGSPPTAQITGPPDGTVFDAGDIITVSGTAEDPDVGPLPPGALSWEIQFLHNDHAHPVTSGTGPSITLTVPTTGHDFTGDTRYLVRLTATDSDGLIGTTSITLRPNKAPVALTSNLATTVTVDSVTHTLPYTIDTVVGFEHVLSVPESHCVDGRLWTFQAWSDGGARTHTITAAPGLAPVATYADTGTCAATGPP
jgi:glucose/arabinose dehydrogenase